MPPWRIYYDDGSIRNYTEGLPQTEAEKLGILVVVQRKAEDHFVTLHGGEYYLFIDGVEWVSTKENGLQDWCIFNLDRVDCIIVGRAILKNQFATILEQAKVDAAKNSLD